jgi:O-methyltransferase
MEARFGSTVNGNLLSRGELLQFIRAFARASEIGPGYYMEFGVLNGSSMVEAWGMLRGTLTHLYGFDSFAGLPPGSIQDELSKPLMPAFKQGNFRSMSRDRVEELILASTFNLDSDMVTLSEGFFEESLPSFDVARLEDKGPCLVAHVDCDLYSSSAAVFRFLDPIVTTGTWLLLDDYWHYRGSPMHGQRRAFDEWMSTSSRIGATEYASYGGFCKAFILHEKL